MFEIKKLFKKDNKIKEYYINKIKEIAKDGDIFLVASNSFISKVIIAFQNLYWKLYNKKSLFSHTGFIFPSKNEVWHSTMDFKGLKIIHSGIKKSDLSYLINYPRLAIVKLKLTRRKRKRIYSIIQNMYKYENIKYPVEELFGTALDILIAYIFNKPEWALKKNIFDKIDKMYCCSFVLTVLRKAKINAWKCLDPDCSTVDNLYYYELEEKICNSDDYASIIQDIVFIKNNIL